MRVALALTLAILVVEAVVGFAAHSLALLSDAAHISVDAAALGLAWFALAQSRRPPDVRRTYGYHRVGILAAMANGGLLIAVVAAVAVEAVRRLARPEPVLGVQVIIAASLALAVNAYIAARLRRSGGSLNVRAALLHVLGDLLASAAVIVSGLVVTLTGWRQADPLVSLGVAALIAWGAARIVNDTVQILLEGVPGGIDLERVETLIASEPGVEAVHDLHVWALAPEHLALSCHVVVGLESDVVETEHLVRRIEHDLCREFSIGHTTIQAEACHPCEGSGHGPDLHNHVHQHADRPSPHRH